MSPPLLAALALLVAPALALASDAPRTNEGESTWRAQCQSCHGQGDGRTRMGQRLGVPDLTAAAWQGRRTDADIRTAILEGSPSNPAMRAYQGSLTDTQVRALVAYIRQLGPKK